MVRRPRFPELRTPNFELGIAHFSDVSRFSRHNLLVLADFFSILLRAFLPRPQPSSRNHPIHTLNGFEHLLEMAGV
jgi:hypothetical protein